MDEWMDGLLDKWISSVELVRVLAPTRSRQALKESPDGVIRLFFNLKLDKICALGTLRIAVFALRCVFEELHRCLFFGVAPPRVLSWLDGSEFARTHAPNNSYHQ
mmetsp:Transcript_17676/g.40709  ORF Transcript_17676/g.40709 Transcript_17676/m.40709 type:complete len:105 (-) Transcript_17676:449-763(-)